MNIFPNPKLPDTQAVFIFIQLLIKILTKNNDKKIFLC